MKLVILDRDGVINFDSAQFIKSPAEWKPIPGSLEAIAKLNQAGYRVVVATNQSGIARGLFTLETLGQIHRKMHDAVLAAGGHIEAVFYCPHGPDDGCECRKPKAGLLRSAAARLRVELDGVPVIGDSARDLDAARAVGAWPILVRTGKGERTLLKSPELAKGTVFDDLAAATDALLAPVDPA